MPTSPIGKDHPTPTLTRLCLLVILVVALSGPHIPPQVGSSTGPVARDQDDDHADGEDHEEEEDDEERGDDRGDGVRIPPSAGPPR